MTATINIFIIQLHTWCWRFVERVSKCRFVSSPSKNLNSWRASRRCFSSSKEIPIYFALKCCASPFSCKKMLPQNRFYTTCEDMVVFPLSKLGEKVYFQDYRFHQNPPLFGRPSWVQNLPVVSLLSPFPSLPSRSFTFSACYFSIRTRPVTGCAGQRFS